jgi:O-antigen/teichoic acid export membrane protein
MAAIGLRLGAGVLVLPLVLHRLTPIELGVWYSLQAIVNAGLLIDLGFGSGFTRHTAYLHAGAKSVPTSGLSFESLGGANWKGISDLRATSARFYYAIAAFLMPLLLFAVDYSLGQEFARPDCPGSVRLAAVLCILASCTGLAESRHGAILTGLGDVTRTQKAALASVAMQLAVSFILVLSGLGLVALAVATLAASLTNGVLCRLMLSAKLAQQPQGIASWKLLRVMAPMALRLGAVSVGTYLITQANTLVCTRMLGVAATASFGLSVQIVQIIASISLVFVSIKLPLVASLRQSGDLDHVRAIWVTAMRRLLIVFVTLGLGAILLGDAILTLLRARTGLLSAPLLLALLLIRMLEAHHAAHAMLVITENRVPFLVAALASGTAIVGLSVLLIPIFGMWAVVAVPGLVQALWNNWWTVWRGLKGIEMSMGQYGTRILGLR